MYDRSACTPFCTSEDLAEHCAAYAASSPDGDGDDACQFASDLLAMLSGWSVYGTCTAIVRPVGIMRLHGLDAIRLQFPVRDVSLVTLDGEVVDPRSYDIVDDEYLVRLADYGTRRNAGWLNCHQDLGLPSTEVGTLEVTYTFGTDIPYLAKAAAIELACELWTEMHPTGDEACSLPATIRSLSLQGASYAFDEAADEIREAVVEGRFKKVARFLATFNPDSRRLPSEIYSPDMPKLVAMRSAQVDQPAASSDSVALELVRGDVFEHLLTREDSVGNAINVCARTYAMQLRRVAAQDTADATCTVVDTDCANGNIVFTFDETVSRSLLPGTYHFDIQEDDRTILRGTVTVVQDVTR